MSKYTTIDEINFIKQLENKSPKRCLEYCIITLERRQVWDSTVNAGAVRDYALSTINRLRPNKGNYN